MSDVLNCCDTPMSQVPAQPADAPFEHLWLCRECGHYEPADTREDEISVDDYEAELAEMKVDMRPANQLRSTHPAASSWPSPEAIGRLGADEVLIAHGPIDGDITVVVEPGRAAGAGYDLAETRFHWRWDPDAMVGIWYVTADGIEHQATGPIHEVRLDIAAWRTGRRMGPRTYRRHAAIAMYATGCCAVYPGEIADSLGEELAYERADGERWRDIAERWQVPVRALVAWYLEHRARQLLRGRRECGKYLLKKAGL
ncbi:hypothetical protein [Nocardia niwae]|uniref:hypothetical protein n=1 Tax=Nocardia niwae TaxID=626084 RepID=UPI0033D2CB3D